jgi:hypothetical protein
MWLYWAKYIMWLYWAMTGQEKGDQVTTRADLTVHKKSHNGETGNIFSKILCIPFCNKISHSIGDLL